MRSAFPIGLCLAFAFVVSWSGPLEAQEKANLNGEIAWARTTWTGELRGVHFKSPLASLLAWVPAGRAVQAYIWTEDHACQRVELFRDTDGDDEAPPTLRGKTNFSFSTDGGKARRSFNYITVGQLLNSEDCCYASELRGPDGRWHEDSSGGIGLPDTTYGALSYADDHVARFGGEPIVINAICDGPIEWLPCASGGERPCNRCQNISITLTEGGPLDGYGRDFGGRRITCREPCPRYVESATMARLNELLPRVAPWRPRRRPISRIPSLHRSRETCVRDHLSGDRKGPQP